MIDFGLKDCMDILLVAVMLYYIYRVMHESRSINMFIGIVIFIIVWVLVSQVFEMRLLGTILDKLVSVGVVVIVVIFQEDIRKFLYNLGAHRSVRTVARLFMLHRVKEDDDAQVKKSIMPIVMAVMSMAKDKVGALIVMEREVPLDDVVATGDVIDAAVNQRLIENIFFKNSPLHDGAMIISNHRIKAAACILPVSHNLEIPKELGLRHRAALGMSQESDALCIIVSEENGGISIARNGQFSLRLSAEELESILTTFLKEFSEKTKK